MAKTIRSHEGGRAWRSAGIAARSGRAAKAKAAVGRRRWASNIADMKRLKGLKQTSKRNGEATALAT